MATPKSLTSTKFGRQKVAPQAPIQTFAPRTDTGTLESNSSEAFDSASGPAETTQYPLLGPVPPGVPELFWAAQEKAQTDRLNGMSAWDSARFWKAYQSDRSGPKRAAENAWKNLPPVDKNNYTQAQEEGAPGPVGSPEYETWSGKQEATETKEENVAAFDEWERQYLPGIRELIEDAQSGDRQALDDLAIAYGQIKDPGIQKYVGDYVSQAAQAGARPEDIEAQQRQLSKYEKLSDPTITAEERLASELLRRQQEQDLKAQRGAFANDLQARGVYGSGAEIGMNAAAQQEQAQRRALEELGLLSNANARSLEALKGASDVAGQMRESGAGESQFRGTAADHAFQFNKTLKTEYDKWKTEEERKINEGKVNRAKDLADLSTGIRGRAVERGLELPKLTLQETGMRTGTKSGDTPLVIQTGKDEGNLSMFRDKEEELKW